MTRDEAKVGSRVKTLTAWVGVEAETQGTIVEDYGTGVTVEWDMKFTWKPLRDGFSNDELHYLELVAGPIIDWDAPKKDTVE